LELYPDEQRDHEAHRCRRRGRVPHG